VKARSPLDWPLAKLLAALREGKLTVAAVAEAVIAREETLRPTRAFTFFDAEELRREAARLDRLGPPRRRGERPLHGLPVSLKDLFDARGQPTGCGSSFFAETRPTPARDGSEAARWRAAGALLVGKTHLNEFAYGITGENLHLGPCLQPRDLARLTGGSSSGAAATVQGGAAAVGVGTDTGGSLRVPAALCGLASWRQSTRGRVARGMFPLAPSFDSVGWVQRDLADVALIWEAMFGALRTRRAPWRVAFLSGKWLEGCESSILAEHEKFARALAKSPRVRLVEIEADFSEAPEIFSGIQAYEAARIHRNFLKKFADRYDLVVFGRLEWGASITPENYRKLQRARTRFSGSLRKLFAKTDFLIAPAAPYLELRVGENFDSRRRALLQITTPFSLAGLPALVAPWRKGAPGSQILAPRGDDARLAAFSRDLAQWPR
jgi:Asp-tRNA(Asn)/Glu-tRNA(Gln) amidotransferase A subunit family amidase